MNRVTEMKVNKIIILSRSKSSRKIEFKLYFFFFLASFFLWQPSSRSLQFRFFMRLYLEYLKTYPKLMFLSREFEIHSILSKLALIFLTLLIRSCS